MMWKAVGRDYVEGPEWGEMVWKALSGARCCGRPCLGRDEMQGPEG